MGVIGTQKNGKHLNTPEKYHTYKINKNYSHMNDTNIDTVTRMGVTHKTGLGLIIGFLTA
jgi:hypothetical protein